MLGTLAKDLTGQERERRECRGLTDALNAREDRPGPVAVVPIPNRLAPDRTVGRSAFGPADRHAAFAGYLRRWLPGPRRRRVVVGLCGLGRSMFLPPADRWVPYGGLKFRLFGVDDRVEKAREGLSPGWRMEGEGGRTMDVDALFSQVSRDYPAYVGGPPLLGLETGSWLDIDRLPFVGGGRTLIVFNGELYSDVLPAFYGYWNEFTTLAVAPRALDHPDFPCSWGFETRPPAGDVRIRRGLLPAVSWYAFIHPHDPDRWSVQEVTVVLNRSMTAVVGLQICVHTLHCHRKRPGNGEGMTKYLQTPAFDTFPLSPR